MDLFVVRHAIAEERTERTPDADRALTEEGARRFRAHVRALDRLEVRFDEVLHSPWLRAARTAALLAPLCANAPSPLDALARPPDERLLEALARDGGTTLAVVGHEPWLSALVAWLVAGDRELGARFAMKKGAVAHLEGEPRPGRMRLVALMPPRLLRLAAK